MRGQGQFQPNAGRRARQGRSDGFAALFGFEIHPRQFDFTQQRMHLHNAVKQPLRGVIARLRAHIGQYV